ncbi:MAG: hypothetical protein MI746_12545 [Pseudomonadales bacterium]|nr:hypothetical protein [Pseudomonadales bacterium]
MTASAILFFHVFSGTIGLFSGAASMISRKGSRVHKQAGFIFVVSMICMAVGGILTGYIRENAGGILVAVFALYSVVTAWMTIHRKEGEIGIFEHGAFSFISITGLITLAIGLGVESGRIAVKDGGPGSFYFFTVVAIIFASGDLRMMLKKGISGAERLARHIWRMNFTFFFGALSFFLGQQQVFPEWILNTPILYVPEVLILSLTAFWLYEVLIRKSSRSQRERYQTRRIS